MIIDPRAKTITLKGKTPKPFRIVSTRKWEPTPPDCWACGQPADNVARITTPSVSTGSIEGPICTACLCIYKNDSQTGGGVEHGNG